MITDASPIVLSRCLRHPLYFENSECRVEVPERLSLTFHPHSHDTGPEDSFMTSHFDVVCIGLGAAGSAAFYHLAKSKRHVLGVDRFTPPHKHGSTHGESRIIRRNTF